MLMILCWAALIAVLGRMRPVGHGLDSPVLGIWNTRLVNDLAQLKNGWKLSYKKITYLEKNKCFI